MRPRDNTRVFHAWVFCVWAVPYSTCIFLFSRAGNQCFVLRLIIFRLFPYFSISKKSFLQRFTNGKCEEFFRYIYDKMRDAEAEIRATITVQTTESSVVKKSDKDVSHAKTADGRRGTLSIGRRDTLVAGQRHKRKSVTPQSLANKLKSPK